MSPYVADEDTRHRALLDAVQSFSPDEAENRIEQWCVIGSDDVGDGWCRAELGDIRDESST